MNYVRHISAAYKKQYFNTNESFFTLACIISISQCLYDIFKTRKSKRYSFYLHVIDLSKKSMNIVDHIKRNIDSNPDKLCDTHERIL